MGEVGLMDQLLKVIGCVFLYAVIGLVIARRIHPPRGVSWVEVRLMAALFWPVVALGLASVWIVRNGAALICGLIQAALEWLEEGKPAEDKVAKETEPPKPEPKSPYRSVSDADRLQQIYSEQDRLKREEKEIYARMENKRKQDLDTN